MPDATTPPWDGFHHVAIVTRDLDATIRFYEEVLGMKAHLLDDGTPAFGRHCMISPGTDATRGMHVIERPGVTIDTHPEVLERGMPLLDGVFQHVSFGLPDREAALALQDRLRARGRVVTELIETGRFGNVMFADDNGVLLEATYPRS